MKCFATDTASLHIRKYRKTSWLTRHEDYDFSVGLCSFLLKLLHHNPLSHERICVSSIVRIAFLHGFQIMQIVKFLFSNFCNMRLS